MTLATMLADLYRRLGYAAAPDSTVTTRLTAFLNEAQQDLMGNIQGLRNAEWALNFASVADVQQYSVYPSTDTIKAIRDTTNRRTLDPMNWWTYRQILPDPSAVTGVPTHWIDMGLYASPGRSTLSLVGPTAAASLVAASTSAADNTQTLYLEGMIDAGYPATNSFVLNGVTAVASTRSDWVTITKLFLSGTAAGVVSLYQTSVAAGNLLAAFPAGQLSIISHRVALYPTPAGVYQYAIETEPNWTDLVQSNDVPILPVKFHRLLMTGARQMEYERRGHLALMAVAGAELEKGRKELAYFVYSTQVGRPSLSGGAVPTPYDAFRGRLTAW